MKRLSLLIVLISSAMLAAATEPVGVDKRRAPPTTAQQLILP